jgi:hypothetical protein
MGSYCSIHFDKLSICDSKSYVPTDWAVLFQESDRREEIRPHEDAEPGDEDYEFIFYETSRETFLWRLSLVGASDSAMTLAFDAWIAQERETWKEYAETWKGESRENAKARYEALATLDFDAWKAHANQTLHTRYNFANPYEPQTELERGFHGHNDSYLHFAGYGDLLTIRAMLEACTDIKTIKLDISDLVNGGYIEHEDRVCELARQTLPQTTQPLGPTVILGEGSTDIRVLQSALKTLHPALADYFSFFNHTEFSVDGGAVYLVKFLKAFAAAQMSSRMIAVFDNDVAGVQAYEQACALGLPQNIIVTRLPDIELARSYPTVGPSGPATLDVNGSAAGIELYLGREALTSDEDLRPVRWTGYNSSAKKYQGEVEGKADVLAAYLKQIDTYESPVLARKAFPELEEVWQMLFNIVERNVGEVYLQRHELLLQERE